MLDRFASPIVVCRPYLPQDKPRLLEIARRTWNGNDYVPFVLDGWIADTTGWIFCAILEDRPVGMIRLSRLSDTQWWLEGLRVDPDMHGGKIGQHLFAFALDFWRTKCRGVIRMLTGENNSISQHIADKHNFLHRSTLDLYEADPLSEGVNDMQLAEMSDLEKVFDWLNELERHPLLIPYLDYGWVINSPEKPMIKDLISKHRIFINTEQGSVLILQPEFSQDYPVSFIQAIQPGHDELEKVLVCARQIQAESGWGKLSWMAPVNDEIHQSLIQAGFHRIPDERVRLYELLPESR